jgi:ankyrin repeat protein
VAVVRLLLSNGADMNHSNDRVFDPCVPVPIGSTPMHLAVVQNNSTIVLMLLEHYVSPPECLSMWGVPNGKEV